MRQKMSLLCPLVILLLVGLPAKSEACDCGGIPWISEDVIAGQIRSPNYPNNPNPNCHQTCSWGIKRKKGWGIRLVVEDFNIEANYDFLIVNEYRLDPSLQGNQLVSTEIARLTGCYAEGLNHCFDPDHQFITPSQWNISDAAVRLRFTAYGSGTRSGFQFSFRRYPLDEPTTSTSTSAMPPSTSVIPPPSPYHWPRILIAILATIIALGILLPALFFAIGLILHRRANKESSVDGALPPAYEVADYNAARDEVGLIGLSHKG